MTRGRIIMRLGLGWLLMLSGAALLMHSGLAWQPGGSRWPMVESLAGFATAVAGWWLRRSALVCAAGSDNNNRTK